MTEGVYTLSYPIEPQSEQLDDNDYCSCTLNAMMTNLNLNLEQLFLKITSQGVKYTEVLTFQFLNQLYSDP